MAATFMTSVGIESALTTVASRALTPPTGATHAVINNSGTGGLRYRLDGGTPTAAVGNQLAAGASLTFTDPNINYSAVLAGFRGIVESGTATIEVVYFIMAGVR